MRATFTRSLVMEWDQSVIIFGVSEHDTFTVQVLDEEGTVLSNMTNFPAGFAEKLTSLLKSVKS